MVSTVYFISDHHFGEQNYEEEKVHKFITFMEHIKGCETLFIVGDFFNFYFEYKTQIPKDYFNVLCALSALRESGTEVYYIVGNHDFWVGDFFTKKLGINVYKKPAELMLQGKKVFIAHGDELSSFNPVRFVLGNEISKFLFYWIHPDIARSIARLVSRISRKLSNKRTLKLEYLYKFAHKKLEEGFDGVILGHIHSPEHLCYKDKHFLLLGDWTQHFSYGELTGGRFSLCFW